MQRFAQYAIFLALVATLAVPVGRYLARVFEREHTLLDRLFGPLERLVHRLCGIRPDDEMSWGRYFAAFAIFGAVNVLALYLLSRYQHLLPGAPSAPDLSTPMTHDLAANIAVSFVTGTTWQSYAGETTLKYAVQIAGLCTQGFLAGASGLAVGIAFIRGFQRERSETIGNFWADLGRALLWVLLPVAFLETLFFVWQGVPLTWAPYVQATTVEGATQRIALGGDQEPRDERRWLLQRQWRTPVRQPKRARLS